MQIDIAAIIETAPQFLDFDPQHWNSDEGCYWWGAVPVFYTKHSDTIILDIEGEEIEVERIDVAL